MRFPVEPTPPTYPDPALFAALWGLEQSFDGTHPPGDPGAVFCGVRLADGSLCGRGRQYVGAGRALICSACDYPNSELDAPPAWQ